MSKMPAKKKSCFQITSVTQAQVAASSITDDTESLDDPDESRTEDVSSEIFDVSRADYEPEMCDISSSEETLNNVVETETHIPQDGQLPTVSGPPNGGFAYRNVGVAGVALVNQHVVGASGPTGQLPTTVAGVTQHPAPVASGGVSNASVTAAQPTAAVSSVSSTTTSTTSCSSRFRVIKLDHGTGEPFRRGRWTCMEFYERDSEGSVITRTVDSIRHANALDHSADRDSGLGATGGSVAAPTTLSGPGPDPAASDCAYASGPHLHPEPLPQSYCAGPQAHAGAFQPAGYPAVPSSIAVTIQAQGAVQPMAPQSLVPPGTNGVHPSLSLQHVQKSPSMPSAGQAQQFGYSAQQQQHQQFLSGQLLGQPSLAPPGQAEYRPQHLPAQTLSVGQPVSQGPSPVMTPATGVAPGLGPQPGDGSGLPAPQGLLQQPGGSGMASALYQPPGASAGGPHAAVSGVQSAGASAGGPGAQAGVPNHVPAPAAQSPLSQSQGPRAVVAPGPPGVATGLGQGENARRKSDTPPQPLAVSGKDLIKPLIPEGLALGTPTVNSLFGIPINIDGDEDGASGASVVAIDNKIEQAMDLVKSHLMYAVREEVEVLKEQIKELYERNSVLERENAVLKSLANSDQLSQLSLQPGNPAGATPPPQQQPEAPPPQPNVSSA
ncbi:TSC22 domain family protein 2-like [Anguilla rostrata]|uniref:TSC22 domain family protein 2-like n=1 Tax=Anguilla rostrata TaxID=7938 RepID=UPI0030CB5783